MYTSPDDARSDLFLAGAVFIFGPLLLRLAFGIIPIGRIAAVTMIIGIVAPVVITALVPWLLIRYRGESLATYGLSGNPGWLVPGLLAAAPIIAAAAVGGVVDARGGMPMVPVLTVSSLPEAYALVSRTLAWGGVAFLAVFVSVKARDAFRYDPERPEAIVREIGRILLIIAGVAIALRLLLDGLLLTFVAVPAGVVGAVLLAQRQSGSGAATSRSVLLAPTVLIALGGFALSFTAGGLAAAAWRVAVLGGVGLATGLLVEGQKSGLPALGLALGLALLTGLDPIPRLFGF